MDPTGERFLPSFIYPENCYEHWHRYFYASTFVRGKKVLDAASGEGYGSFLLSEFAKNVTGIDISEEAISDAQNKYKRANLEYKIGSITDIPIEGEHLFDVIISFETIEHVTEEEQVKFMKEVKRLLKPSGLFIVSTPNKRLYSDIPEYDNEFHIKEFYVDEFNDFLKGYFDHVSSFGQQIYAISNIWQLDSSQSGNYKEFLLDYDGKGYHEARKQEKDPLYQISICSDEEITTTDPSLLFDISNQLIKQKNTDIVELDSKINTLNGTIVKNSEESKKYQKELENKVAELHENAEKSKQYQKELEERADELAGKNEELTNNSEEAKKYQKELEGKINELARKNEELINNSEESKKYQKELEGKVNELHENEKGAKKCQKELEKEVQNLYHTITQHRNGKAYKALTSLKLLKPL